MLSGRPWTVRRLMVLVALASLPIAGVVALLRSHGAGREAARHAQCANNLKQLSLALLNYESAWGSLPPAYLADAKGRPLLSWRVLVLPYLGEDALYQRFRLDESWDAPNNLPLIPQMPPVFACPTHQPGVFRGGPRRHTSYLAATGPGTLLPGPTPALNPPLRNGLNETVVVLESSQADVPWSAPIDIDVRTGTLANATAPAPPGPTTPHPYGLNVTTIDGLAHRIDPDKIRRVLGPSSTIAGGRSRGLAGLRAGPR